MFYSDYVAVVKRVERFLALFASHYDECIGITVIRSVSFDNVVWC